MDVFLYISERPLFIGFLFLTFLFVIFAFAFFPLVFLLAPTGVGVLDTVVAEASYLMLDIVTKILFGIKTTWLKAS